MEEVNNLSQDDVLELIGNFPLQPLRNKVIITVNVDEPDDDLVLSSSSFSEVQYVIAVGDFVKGFEPGQKVLLDTEKMMEYTQSDTDQHERIGRIKIRPIEVNGRIFAIVNDGVIECKDGR